MHFLTLIALSAASVFAAPAPQAEKPALQSANWKLAGCTESPCIVAKYGSEMINWGNAEPNDVLSYLGKPDGVCGKPGAELSCDDGVHMTNLPTMIVNPNLGPMEDTFDIVVKQSEYPNPEVRDIMLKYLGESLVKLMDRRKESWEVAQFESGAIPGLTEDKDLSGEMGQNYGPAQMTVAVQSESNAQWTIEIEVRTKAEKDAADFCKFFLNIVGGVAGGVAGFFGPVAVLAGASSIAAGSGGLCS